MRVGVLGPLEVIDDQGHPIDVGGQQQRLVLAALVAAGDRPVETDALIELIWRDRPPASAAGTLQSYVSRLRRVLGPADGAGVVFANGTYRLELPPEAVDAHRFGALADAGHEALAAGRPLDAHDRLAEALALWRGSAFVDLTDRGIAIHRAAALEEQRLVALEARFDADLALGRHEPIIGELRELVSGNPLREGLHARLALALYRSGRQAEALRAIADAGGLLREELGLEPGRALVELESAILDHDPTIDAPVVVRRRVDTDTAGVFVGRDAELGVLLSAYDAAVGDAQFVVVEGDPGIGKTRLADEAGARFVAEGSRVAWARGDEFGTSALWPWLDVVRELRSQNDDVPPLIDELEADADAPFDGPSPSYQWDRFEAIALLLERVGARAPVVVVLDDLQWFDPASFDLLRFLTTRASRNVLVIATLRTLEIGRADALTDVLGAIARRPGSRRLRLTGLSPAASAELIDAVSAEVANPERAARIHERAEGNPFYTLELARLLDQPGTGDEDVPATVADTVRRRLQQLSSSAIDVLTVGAVVGRDVDLALVATVAGLDLDRCADELDAAAAHRLLVPAPLAGGRLRFAHALVREVLLDGLTPLRRARLHLRVAEALEATGRGDVEVVADHLWRAAPLGVGDRAAVALERAAQRAVSRTAYSTAEEMLRRAVDLRRTAAFPDSLTARSALLDAQLRLIDVMQARQYFSGTDRALLRDAQSLASELGRDDTSRELAWSEWASVSRAADVAAARAIADRYRQRWATSERPDVRAGALVIDGVTAWAVGDITSAVERLDEAAGAASGTDATGAFERQVLLVGRVFGLYCHAAHGDISPDDAIAGFDRLAAELPERVVDGRHQLVYALACRVAAVHRRWDALDRMVRRALDLDAAGQFAFFGGQILLYRALLEARAGQLDAALATFTDGRTRFRAVGGRTGIATCQALLAGSMAQARRLGDASSLVTAARQEIIDTGETINEVPVRIAEAELALADGDPATAADHLTAAVATAHRQGAHALADQSLRLAHQLGLPTVV